MLSFKAIKKLILPALHRYSLCLMALLKLVNDYTTFWFVFKISIIFTTLAGAHRYQCLSRQTCGNWPTIILQNVEEVAVNRVKALKSCCEDEYVVRNAIGLSAFTETVITVI
jgi:hypothetical protein